MNVEDVEKLILLMQRYELNELQLKEEKWEFSARRGEKNNPQQQHVVYAQQPMMPSQSSAALQPAPGGSGVLPVAVPPAANRATTCRSRSCPRRG